MNLCNWDFSTQLMLHLPFSLVALVLRARPLCSKTRFFYDFCINVVKALIFFPSNIEFAVLDSCYVIVIFAY